MEFIILIFWLGWLYISLGKVLSFNENYNEVVKCYESSQTFYYLQVNKYEEAILQLFPNKITGTNIIFSLIIN